VAGPLVLSVDDRLAILALYAEYNRSIDCCDGAAWITTWASDGVFEHPARSFTGHLELDRFVMDRGEAMKTHSIAEQRHWNAEIEIWDSAEGARGRCLLLLAGVERASGQPVVVARGRYQDALVRQHGNWRFARRSLVLTNPS
jgi:hypothetical protein